MRVAAHGQQGPHAKGYVKAEDCPKRHARHLCANGVPSTHLEDRIIPVPSTASTTALTHLRLELFLGSAYSVHASAGKMMFIIGSCVILLLLDMMRVFFLSCRKKKLFNLLEHFGG